MNFAKLLRAPFYRTSLVAVCVSDNRLACKDDTVLNGLKRIIWALSTELPFWNGNFTTLNTLNFELNFCLLDMKKKTRKAAHSITCLAYERPMFSSYSNQTINSLVSMWREHSFVVYVYKHSIEIANL